MKGFLKTLLASMLGFIIGSLLLFFLMLWIVGGIVSLSQKQEVTTNPGTILLVKLDQPIPERSTENPLENFDFKGLKMNQPLGLTEIIENIKKAKNDNTIKGILLELNTVNAGYATIEEIRNALLDFKKSGKFIVSYSDAYDQKAYYLASVASKVYLNPGGVLPFVGLEVQKLFFKGMFDKLGIEAELIRHGKFKSAGEPYITDKMSPENRQQVSSYLNSIWNRMLQGISESRKISIKELNNSADQAVLGASQAKKFNLVDSLVYKDEVLAQLCHLTGKSNPQKLEFIALNKYNKVPAKRAYVGLAKAKIAVIYAYGDVMLGEGEEGEIGSERISKALRDARTDTSVKAIVLRVNSPGGMAIAAEVIWREMVLAKKVKPVIASLGSVAASGGYYIACPADTIVASPNTITGSIGVFGLMFNASTFMNKKLGITSDVVKTNEHADLATPLRKMSPSERAIIQANVDETYDVFIDHVAKGRHMTKAGVDDLAQGRVWTAAEGKELGLIDVIGGLNIAIDIAAKKAKLTRYRILSLPKLEDPFTQLMKGLTSEVRTSLMERELGENAIYFKELKKIMKTQGVLAKMPYELDIY
jgi:protease IV